MPEKRWPVKEDLVAENETLAEVNQANAVNIQRGLADQGDVRMPVVYEAVLHRQGMCLGPDPIWVLAQELREICTQGIPAPDAGRQGWIRIKSVVGIEREQSLWVIACPCREPPCGKFARLLLAVSTECLHAKIMGYLRIEV